MENYKLLEEAKSINIKALNRKGMKSSMGLIETLIKTIYLDNITNEEKNLKLNELIRRIKSSSEEDIGGCKRDNLKIAIDIIFKLEEKQFKIENKTLKELSFKEIYLYFCYIRMLSSVSGYCS